MITLLIIAAVLALLFGGYSWHPTHREAYGYWGWSPLGVVLVVLLLFWLSGRL